MVQPNKLILLPYMQNKFALYYVAVPFHQFIIVFLTVKGKVKLPLCLTTRYAIKTYWEVKV